ncbi:hypothetical protein ONR57_16085 [Hoyosella sp. YIM 151337]|uniref:hypothetical protein n=1 Tax=Hoyosella sp. YIM 151337 TaxID=2992742 RepID=UPI0022368A65|nr:hypothetical protein [Hoyosella sp. YIM 151337]MCW4354825.1 hypothetical protein [Hoyosella sp. YIM 151337]
MTENTEGQPGDITGGERVHTTSEEIREDQESHKMAQEDSTSHTRAAGTVPDTSELDPDVVERAKERVSDINEQYRPGSRPTVRVPGTGATVTGTAFAEDYADHEENRDLVEESSGDDIEETDEDR